jgi:hypothetical protein
VIAAEPSDAGFGAVQLAVNPVVVILLAEPIVGGLGLVINVTSTPLPVPDIALYVYNVLGVNPVTASDESATAVAVFIGLCIDEGVPTPTSVIVPIVNVVAVDTPLVLNVPFNTALVVVIDVAAVVVTIGPVFTGTTSPVANMAPVDGYPAKVVAAN